MQTRATRFWLRFDSGPRQGETVPLAEGTLSVGRRSANQIVLADGSVSGFHAELHVGAAGVEVVDIESTNGTRVGSERVERAPLAHGDTVTFGNIEGTLLDQEFLGEAGAGTTTAAGGEELERVGASQLAASGRRGVLAPLLLLLAVGGGAAALYFLGPGAESGGDPTPVEPVAGNLLSDGAFEGEGPGSWETAAAASEAFAVGSEFARTGAFGLGVVLEAGTDEDDEPAGTPWSFAVGTRHAVGSGRGLELSAWVQSGDAALGRVGLAFDSDRGEGPAFVAWSRAVPADDAFTELTLRAAVPPGYDHVAVAIAARGEGWTSLDDVVLREADAPAALAEADGLAAHGYGADGTTLTLVRSGRVLFPVLDFGGWGPGGAHGGANGSWSASASETGLVLTPRAPADARLEAQVVAGEAAAGEQDGGWLATLGAGGYRSHAAAFQVPAATDLLVGRGFDLLRVSLEPAAALVGRVREGVLVLSIEGTPGLRLQGSFGEERAAARQLRTEAAQAERAGRSGEALAHWQRLLDELPFEAELVAEAEAERSRLVQEGLERVEEVRREVERARFFGLRDLYRQTLARAEAIGDSYRGTEVAREAEQVASTVEEELASLTTNTEDADVTRVRGVLRALDGTEAEAIRDHVRQALSELGHDHDRERRAAPDGAPEGGE